MRLAIFAGPSGGHFYPALAFAQGFQKSHPEARIVLVTGERGRFLVEKAKGYLAGAEFQFLADCPFPRETGLKFFFRFLVFLLKFAEALLKSEEILSTFSPDLCVGFGSYVAFPGIIASRRRKIPTLIHEQNRKMGQANLWLAGFVDTVALSFKEGEVFSSSPARIATGLPLRSALLDCGFQANRADSPFLSSGKIRVLVVGGSQGSRSLNHLWRRTLERFSNEEKRQIAVIHITGRHDYEAVKTMYVEEGIEAHVFDFYERMEEIYSEADIAVTRAGASTLFELALFGLPAVVVPYPHAEGHQEANALYFEERGAAVLVLEKRGASESMKREISGLMYSKSIRSRMSENLKRLARPDATEKLVETADAILEKGRSRKELREVPA